MFNMLLKREVHKVLLLLFVALMSASSHAQVKHGPTVEQCRADQRQWLDKLENSTVRPDYETLTGWFDEMFDCGSVDPENRRLYYNVMGEIDVDEGLRLEHFLRRHGLWNDFLTEDRAGKR